VGETKRALPPGGQLPGPEVTELEREGLDQQPLRIRETVHLDRSPIELEIKFISEKIEKMAA